MLLSEKLKKVREDRHLSLSQASQMLDLSKSTLFYYEDATSNKKPNYDAIKKIAKGYNVSYEYILDDDVMQENQNNISEKSLPLNPSSIKKIRYYNKLEYNFIMDTLLENLNSSFFELFNAIYVLKRLANNYSKMKNDLPVMKDKLLNYLNTYTNDFLSVLQKNKKLLKKNKIIYENLKSSLEDIKITIEERKIDKLSKKILFTEKIIQNSIDFYTYKINVEFNKLIEKK